MSNNKPLPVCLLLILHIFWPVLAKAQPQPGFSQCLEYLKKEGKKPDQYVVDKFRTYDVVMLGEHHLIRQNLHFVHALIPLLHKAGVYTLGMEFGASEDQKSLDSLLSAPEYSEAAARRIMFSYNTAWGFKEYMDVYRKAWELNRSLPKGARKFRILNISYRFNWEGFQGTRTPETLSRVFHKGTNDKFRADLVEREILSKGDKILLLMGTPHAYTRYAQPQVLHNNDNFCHYDSAWTGNRLYRKFPGKVTNIMLHQAFYAYPDRMPWLVSPANGAIERLMAAQGNKPLGFDLAGTPMGRLPDSSRYSMCYPDFRMGKLFDGYVFLTPLKELDGCTVDERFVTEQNLQQAIRQFPDPDWRKKPTTLEEFRRTMEDMRDIRKQYAGIGN